MVQSLGPFGYNINARLDQLASGPRGKFELWAPTDPPLLPLSLNYVCILLPISTFLVHIAANSRLYMAVLLYFAHSPRNHSVFLCWHTIPPRFAVCKLVCVK